MTVTHTLDTMLAVPPTSRCTRWPGFKVKVTAQFTSCRLFECVQVKVTGEVSCGARMFNVPSVLTCTQDRGRYVRVFSLGTPV